MGTFRKHASYFSIMFLTCKYHGPHSPVKFPPDFRDAFAITLIPSKESLDFLQMIKSKLDGSTMVVFRGDLNADPGAEGGPWELQSQRARSNPEHVPDGCWGYTSCHLHLNTVPSSHTYEADHNGYKSTIDHLLCSE